MYRTEVATVKIVTELGNNSTALKRALIIVDARGRKKNAFAHTGLGRPRNTIAFALAFAAVTRTPLRSAFPDGLDDAHHVRTPYAKTEHERERVPLYAPVVGYTM